MTLAGLKVNFHHNLINKTTICAVSAGETILGEGSAKCGQNDTFSKKVGRKVALTKALTGLPKDTRSTIWNDYKNQAKIV